MIPIRNYKYRYLILLILIALFLLLGVKATSSKQEIPLSDCFLEASRIPYYPQPQTYGALIEELVECESGGNPEALGDDGRAHGVLQFHRPTFERYCVDRYGYVNDIWNEEIQRECAKEMIEENFNNVANWTCYESIR